MKLTRFVISLLTLIVVLTTVGCKIAETIEVEIIYAPQFHSTFAVSSAPVVINNARIFIYNPDQLLIRDTMLTGEQLRSTEPILLIRGVAAGDYTMVSYYNLDQMMITGNEVGVSTIEHLEFGLDLTSTLKLQQSEGDLDFNIDSLCHSFVPFTIQRGAPTIKETQIAPTHYFVTVKVTGLDKPTVPLGELSVKLIDLPISVDSRSDVSGKYDIDIPLVKVSDAELEGHSMSLRFLTEAKVKLHIFENMSLNQTMFLEPENYVTSGTPSNELNISVEFLVNSCIVSVNDWQIGEFEIVDLGG